MRMPMVSLLLFITCGARWVGCFTFSIRLSAPGINFLIKVFAVGVSSAMFSIVSMSATFKRRDFVCSRCFS